MDHGAVGVAGAGVHDEAGGFVDDDEVRVAVDDGKRDGLRFEDRRRVGRRVDVDLLAGGELDARARRGAVEAHVAVADPGREAGAAVVGEAVGEEAVEPAPRRLVGDGQQQERLAESRWGDGRCGG